MAESPGPGGRFSSLVTSHLKEDGSRSRPRRVEELPPKEAVKTISNLGKEQKWQDALDLFWHRKTYNTRVWNAMLCACAGANTRSRAWEVALGLLERLEADPYCDADVVSC